MTTIYICENGNKVRDFIGPIKEFPEFSTLEINSYRDGERPLSLIVEYLDDMKDFKFLCPVLLAYDSSTTNTQKLEAFLAENPGINGTLDLDKSLSLQIPLIREFLRTINKNSKVDELEQKVKNLRKETKSQLEIIKKTFEKMVPVRTSKNNGINIYVKFASGLSSGGEFFDFINKNMQTLILWNKSMTYEGSNNFLDHFQAFESDNYDIPNLENFIKNLGPEEGQEAFLAQINLKNLTFSGFNISNCLIYFNGDKEIPSTSFKNLEPFSIKLERGERFFILSSGVMENLKELNPDFNLLNKLKELSLLSPREVLDELFFELKRNSKKKFLPKDCAIILIEVDKNVIFEV